MGTTVVKRPVRQPEPEYPSGEILLDSPPEIPAPAGRGWGRLLMLLPMLAGSGAMALMYAGRGGTTLSYVMGGMFGLSAIGMLVSQVSQASGANKVDLAQQRREYMRHLSKQRKRVLKTIEAQRRAVFYRNPDPARLGLIPTGPRLWERRRQDPDFATVRVGLGPQELATPLVPPAAADLEKLEPMCALALRRFMTSYAEVPDLPVTMALNGFARVHISGGDNAPQALVRAIIAQVAAFHSPDDMMVAICVSNDRRAEWEWTKWLPHALHPVKTDALGQLRLVAQNVAGLEAMLDDVLASRPRFNPSSAEAQIAGPHLVVVLDGGDTAGSDHLMTEGGVEGVTILDLSHRAPRTMDRSRLILEIDRAGKLSTTTFDGQSPIGAVDGCTVEELEALALRLSPLRLSLASRGGGEQSLNIGTELTDLLGIEDPHEFDVMQAWSPRPNRDRLRVPVGVGPDGLPVELDIKESAQDGMGPHGLLIGATGSGKSELLRTLVLALAATHSSESLNFVLVDFKGGATFTKLDKLPHTSAVITNLSDELPLVDRMTDSINGEMLRRQELLRAAGNYASQRDYERARVAGAPLAPLPSLLIICDEFSELLSAKPDFIEMFVQIGRLGRSLGVHLLLASQKLEEGRLRGLDSHLSYRIGLRTFSAMESRIVLGVTDAYELPRSPGHGYLKFGTEPLVRFRAAYVSGTYRSKTAAAIVAGESEDRVQEYTTQYVAPQMTRKPKQEEPAPDTGGESLLDILVGQMMGEGRPAHQVWLPPLKEPPTLDQLYPPLAADPARGVTVADPGAQGRLRVAVGIVDKPFEQRRDVLQLDLAGASGHVIIVGGPQSGKSTLLRTLVTSIALTHTPREAQVYCLDLGSGALSSLRELPHVGGLATRLDSGQVRRTIAELRLLMAQRERRFGGHGVDSMATYRKMRLSGSHTDDPFGDVFLVIDGWASVRADFEDLEATITDIANRGLSFGVHLVATAARWMDVRPAVRDVFGTRLELRLGDPVDSTLDRKAAMNVPESCPGRGITPEGMHYLAGLPRIDGQQDAASLSEGASKLISDIRAAWDGPGAPPVRLLPATVPYASVPHTQETPGIPIGIAEADLQPVYLDFSADPHFLLFGEGESGKSTFLRSLAQGIVDRYDLKQARMIIVDYRRSLLGDITTEHLIGYGSSAQATESIIAEAAGVMRNRLPPADVTPEQLRNRSWWRGPDLYVLVDDYDLVTGGSTNPLTKLLEFLPQARDIGLHLVLTRRTGGASRALYEAVVMRLRELGTPGIVMSGSRDEGVLLGNVRPGPLPCGRGQLVTRRGGTRLVQLLDLPSRALE